MAPEHIPRRGPPPAPGGVAASGAAYSGSRPRRSRPGGAGRPLPGDPDVGRQDPPLAGRCRRGDSVPSPRPLRPSAPSRLGARRIASSVVSGLVARGLRLRYCHRPVLRRFRPLLPAGRHAPVPPRPYPRRAYQQGSRPRSSPAPSSRRCVLHRSATTRTSFMASRRRRKRQKRQ